MSARTSPLTQLFATARSDGRVDLVDLTDDEEQVVGAGDWVLTSAAVRAEWLAQDGHRRRVRTRAALDELVRAGAAGSWEMRDCRLVIEQSPELYLVDAARRNPSFIAYGADDAGEMDGAVSAPRAYGVADVRGRRGVVVELVGPSGHSYRLLSSARFVTSMADWLWRALTTEDLGARVPAASVCVIQAPEGGRARTDHLDAGVDAVGRVRVLARGMEHSVDSPRDLDTHLARSLGARSWEAAS